MSEHSHGLRRDIIISYVFVMGMLIGHCLCFIVMRAKHKL